MAKSGSKSTTEISLDGTTWTNISKAVHGLDGIDTTEEEGTVEVAGGGSRTGMATTGYVTAGASFTVDENVLTRPILTGANGATLHIRYRRDGVGSGRPSVLYVGPATVSHTFGERDKRRYSVEQMVDGAPTRSVQ